MMITRNALFAAGLIAASTPALASMIDTTVAWNGSDNLQSFGSPNTATYGQVVKATGSQLDAFSFIVDLPATLQFQAYAYAWDGTKASGAALFSSGAATDNGSGYNTVSFNTGGTPVSHGQDYVLFLSISEVYAANGNDVTGAFASVDTATYADGEFFWSNNGADFSLLTSQSWEKWFDGDFAFTARFSNGNPNQVPEPAMLALLGLGAIGLGVMKRRQAA